MLRRINGQKYFAASGWRGGDSAVTRRCSGRCRGGSTLISAVHPFSRSAISLQWQRGYRDSIEEGWRKNGVDWWYSPLGRCDGRKLVRGVDAAMTRRDAAKYMVNFAVAMVLDAAIRGGMRRVNVRDAACARYDAALTTLHAALTTLDAALTTLDAALKKSQVRQAVQC
ncbi:hypothetical protein C8J57DRAFT_1247749 [Mycena rebaudengoi]|nr:hypothetical protein C8J57DRAFT_1247749 [Mycena rebaudengoi]